jgi:hypothetical protein
MHSPSQDANRTKLRKLVQPNRFEFLFWPDPFWRTGHDDNAQSFAARVEIAPHSP